MLKKKQLNVFKRFVLNYNKNIQINLLKKSKLNN